jgi:BMFP domain-containing protein YqiC
LGNKSGTEVASSVNLWLKEGGEALKVKIEDEVERSVSKMGFVKRGEFEALKQEVAALKKGTPSSAAKKTPNSAAKKSAKKASAEKSSVKKNPVKKTAKKSAKKVVAKKTAKKVSK